MLIEPITIIQAQPSDLTTVLDILEEATQWVSSKGIEQWHPGQFQSNPQLGEGKSTWHYLVHRRLGRWRFTGTRGLTGSFEELFQTWMRPATFIAWLFVVLLRVRSEER